MTSLFERYLEDHARPHKKASSIRDDEGLIRQMLRPAFGRRKVKELTRADVDAFHKSLKKTPYRANRALALLSKALNLAEVWGWRPDGSNPCRHVKKYREEKRERFLSQQELARLGLALAAAGRSEVTSPRGTPISPYAVAAIRLLIFTGGRRGEILGLRWEHVNFEAGRLELPDSKTGAKFIYLAPAALQLLQELPHQDGNPHVIVGGKLGSALVNLKDPWDAIRKAADLDDLRIHDLRHSFASVGAAGGMSLPIIGALLGHKEIATTARYAHLSDDPLRSAANTIGNKIADALDADAG
jgi:integrase